MRRGGRPEEPWNTLSWCFYGRPGPIAWQVNWVGTVGRGGWGRPYNPKAGQEWVTAPSVARGQTAVPITFHCGSKRLRYLEYALGKTSFSITNYLILVAPAFSVGA